MPSFDDFVESELLSMREQVLQSKILAVLNHREAPCRLWRNNVGVLKDSRGVPIRYGLAPGSADLVGLTVPGGRFLAVEIKTPIGRLSPEQKAWLTTIRQLGGIAIVLRSVEDAEKFVASLRRQLTTDWGGSVNDSSM